jgi:hypothetical protein
MAGYQNRIDEHRSDGSRLWRHYLYVADNFDNAIKRMNPNGVFILLAGGSIQNGYADGVGAQAQFNRPEGRPPLLDPAYAPGLEGGVPPFLRYRPQAYINGASHRDHPA